MMTERIILAGLLVSMWACAGSSSSDSSSTSDERQTTGTTVANGMQDIVPVAGNTARDDDPSTESAGSMTPSGAGTVSPTADIMPIMAGEPTSAGGMPMGAGQTTVEPLPPLPMGDAIPNDLGTRFATAVCEYLTRCEYEELVETITNEQCLPFMERQFEDQTLDRLRSALNADEVRFIADNSEACLSAFSTLACDPDIASLASRCQDGFIGTIELGEACQLHDACRGSAYCDVSGACPGQCTPKKPAGSPCAEDTQCMQNLFCAGNICRPAGMENERCGARKAPCASGLVCDGENGADGDCKPFNSQLLGQGQKCNIQGGPLCNAGLSCVAQECDGLECIEGPVKFTCLPRVDEDEKCHPGLPEHCTEGLYCADTSFDNIFDIDLDGKCRPLPAMDEQCGDAPVGKVCQRDLVCQADICVLRARIGDPCTDDAVCYSGACVANECGHKALCTPN